MKILIKILLVLILTFIAYLVTETNAKILSYTNQIHFSWAGDWYGNYMPLVKALGISLATIVIIISYESKIIRGLFIFLDGSIVFMYQFLNIELWSKYTSAYYGFMTALILLFVGNLAHNYYMKSNSKEMNNNSINSNELRIMEIKKLMDNLKRTGRSGGNWKNYPSRVDQMAKYELELNNLNK